MKIKNMDIKVTNPNNDKHIPDASKNEILEPINIKNSFVFVMPEIPTNKTALKVGKPEVSLRNYQPCKFTKIEITNKIEHDTIFDEGKFIRKINPADNTLAIKEIHYDYDKWHIRADAKSILDEVAKFLITPPFLPVELGSHTDCRGTEAYNLDLSLKRAQSVVDYLIQKGVDASRISAKGYGETKLIVTGKDITEVQHQINRRTTLHFKVFQSNAQTLIHDVIVPSFHMPRTLKIDIRGFDHRQCFQKERHENKFIAVNSYKQAKKFEIHTKKSKEDKGDTTISYAVESFTPSILELFRAFVQYKTNKYHFYLNSCAYYSKGDNATFLINAYPDVNWILHLRYNFADGPFFKDIPVKLVTGIEKLNQIKESILEFIKDIPFLSEEKKENANHIAEMLTDLPNSFQVGMHALHDFTDPKISYASGNYFEKQKDSRIAHVSVTHIKAEPLLGIEYHKEHQLSKLAKKDGSLENLIKQLGITATVKLDFVGTIAADYKVKTNSLTKKVTIKDSLNNHLSNDQGVFTGKGVILAYAEIKAHGKVEKDVTILPFIPSQKVTLEVDLKAKMGGFISLSSQYGIVKSQLFRQDTIEFSGISGTYKQKVVASRNDTPVWNSNPTDKTVPFTLFKPHTIKMGKAIAFKI